MCLFFYTCIWQCFKTIHQVIIIVVYSLMQCVVRKFEPEKNAEDDERRIMKNMVKSTGKLLSALTTFAIEESL